MELLWISFKVTQIISFEQVLSCFVSFVFQGKGNSSVKAATGKDDEGASNNSTDYENHKSANGAEQQMNSFNELNLEEKQGSH